MSSFLFCFVFKATLVDAYGLPLGLRSEIAPGQGSNPDPSWSAACNANALSLCYPSGP